MAYCCLGAGIVQLPWPHRAGAAIPEIGDCPICAGLNWRCIFQCIHVSTIVNCRRPRHGRPEAKRMQGVSGSMIDSQMLRVQQRTAEDVALQVMTNSRVL